MYLIFTYDDYMRLKGSYGSDSELNPRPLANETEWAVGIEVLSEPDFAEIKNDLLQLEQRELTENDFKQE